MSDCVECKTKAIHVGVSIDWSGKMVTLQHRCETCGLEWEEIAEDQEAVLAKVGLVRSGSEPAAGPGTWETEAMGLLRNYGITHDFVEKCGQGCRTVERVNAFIARYDVERSSLGPEDPGHHCPDYKEHDSHCDCGALSVERHKELIAQRERSATGPEIGSGTSTERDRIADVIHTIASQRNQALDERDEVVEKLSSFLAWHDARCDVSPCGHGKEARDLIKRIRSPKEEKAAPGPIRPDAYFRVTLPLTGLGLGIPRHKWYCGTCTRFIRTVDDEAHVGHEVLPVFYEWGFESEVEVPTPDETEPCDGCGVARGDHPRAECQVWYTRSARESSDDITEYEAQLRQNLARFQRRSSSGPTEGELHGLAAGYLEILGERDRAVDLLQDVPRGKTSIEDREDWFGQRNDLIGSLTVPLGLSAESGTVEMAREFVRAHPSLQSGSGPETEGCPVPSCEHGAWGDHGNHVWGENGVVWKDRPEEEGKSATGAPPDGEASDEGE